jgi:hypothetical protein
MHSFPQKASASLFELTKSLCHPETVVRERAWPLWEKQLDATLDPLTPFVLLPSPEGYDSRYISSVDIAPAMLMVLGWRWETLAEGLPRVSDLIDWGTNPDPSVLCPWMLSLTRHRGLKISDKANPAWQSVSQWAEVMGPYVEKNRITDVSIWTVLAARAASQGSAPEAPDREWNREAMVRVWSHFLEKGVSIEGMRHAFHIQLTNDPSTFGTTPCDTFFLFEELSRIEPALLPMLVHEMKTIKEQHEGVVQVFKERYIAHEVVGFEETLARWEFSLLLPPADSSPPRAKKAYL